MRGSYKVALLAVVLATAAVASPRIASAQACPGPPTGVGRVQAAGPSDVWSLSSWFRGLDLRMFAMHGWGRGANRLGTRTVSAVLRERRGLTR